jgi:hypothetical protein
VQGSLVQMAVRRSHCWRIQPCTLIWLDSRIS